MAVNYGKSPVPSKRMQRYDISSGIFDLHPTPPLWTQVLIVSRPLPKVIWEPACGDGRMAEVLINAGCKVFSSDLADWGYGQVGVDFLEQPHPMTRAIVTNPPYALSTNFVEKCLGWIDSNELDLAAFLLKVEFLGSGDRYKRIFSRRMPTEIIMTPNRMNNETTGSSYSFYHAWFVWTKKRPRQSVFKLVPVEDRT